MHGLCHRPALQVGKCKVLLSSLEEMKQEKRAHNE